jgi:hypothetical protein
MEEARKAPSVPGRRSLVMRDLPIAGGNTHPPHLCKCLIPLNLSGKDACCKISIYKALEDEPE